MKDLKELICDEESLDEEELLELVDSKHLIKSRRELKENNWLHDIDLSEIKKGIELAKELELHFLRIDSSTIRSSQFEKDLRKSIAPYREILSNLEKKSFFVFQSEDESSNETIQFSSIFDDDLYKSDEDKFLD